MILTCCQDHILTENIWFVWSEISYSGDKMRCYNAGRRTTNKQLKIELLSRWKLEAEFRNIRYEEAFYESIWWKLGSDNIHLQKEGTSVVITSRGHSAWFAHSERFASEFPHFRLKFPFLYSPNIWYRLWNKCKQCPIVKYCLQAYKWYFKLIPARLIIRFLIGIWSYTFDLYLSSQMGSRMTSMLGKHLWI